MSIENSVVAIYPTNAEAEYRKKAAYFANFKDNVAEFPCN